MPCVHEWITQLSTYPQKGSSFADSANRVIMYHLVHHNQQAQACEILLFGWEVRRGVSRQNCEWAGGMDPPPVFRVGPNAPFHIWIGV